MHTLQFSYVTVSRIGMLQGVLIALPDVIEKISNGYAIYSSEKDDKLHLCPIYQIPKKDLENRGKDDIPTATYNKLIEKFGEKLVDKLIVEEEVMKRNIKNIIEFTMDKVYQVDEMIIEFEIIDGLNAAEITLGNTSSIPDIIYAVLQEYFEIVTQTRQILSKDLYVVIRKKDDKNDQRKTDISTTNDG